MLFRKGQVTILALLIGLLGLTISMSVASRSLSDLRQVTVVDQGTKALAAAEAGVQFALNQLVTNRDAAVATCDPVTTGTAGLTLANISGVKYNVCSNTVYYGIYSAVPQDDVIQVYIGGQPSNVKGFQVLWKNPNASIEITKVTDGNTVSRYLYNSNSSDPTYLNKVNGNGFAPSVAGSQCYRDSSNNNPCADASYNNSNASCAGFWNDGSTDWEIPYVNSNPSDEYLRIKPLYASSDIVICSVPAGGSQGRLQLQYYQITAVATSSATAGKITRKIQTTSLSNFLPAIFDNVLYSGGSLSK